MGNPPVTVEPFAIKDCALIAIATGRRAQTLKELRDNLVVIHPGSIFYHFWGGLLHPKFEEREYNNEFASWTRHALHDATLAERLAVIDPSEFQDLEALREELINVIEARLDEREHLAWTHPDQQFEFIRSQTVVFDTRKQVRTPEELAERLPHLSVGTIFYHFIDARRRPPGGVDDFRAWISSFGSRYDELCRAIQAVDPFFASLPELRLQLADVMRQHLGAAK